MSTSTDVVCVKCGAREDAPAHRSQESCPRGDDCVTDHHAFTSTDTAYDAAIAYATERGREAGDNAAGWYIQDSIGGRTTGDSRPTAARILQGIEDGDPAVMDGFPFPDLSGQWADSLNGPELYNEAMGAARDVDEDEATAADGAEEWFSDICDAYETAFSDAVSDAIATAARDALAGE